LNDEGKTMLDIAKDIQSLSHFKRNSADVMKQMPRRAKINVYSFSKHRESSSCRSYLDGFAIEIITPCLEFGYTNTRFDPSRKNGRFRLSSTFE